MVAFCALPPLHATPPTHVHDVADGSAAGAVDVAQLLAPVSFSHAASIPVIGEAPPAHVYAVCPGKTDAIRVWQAATVSHTLPETPSAIGALVTGADWLMQL